MTAFLIDNMAPIMFGALVVFLLLGYPVAFSLAANGLVFGLIGIELGLFGPNFLQAMPERVLGVMSNETLLAVPFFTFMGLILERSGMAEDLLDTIGQLFGRIRGGLGYAVVFVGALLAATTGVVAASVISMGLISLPIMLRYGYDRRVASGVIAASGTLAQIIPPSLVLIIMADQLGRSVGDMYEGAFLPGLMLAGLYAGYIFVVSTFFPTAAPGLPPDAIGFREENGRRGMTSLAILTLASIAFGWLVMLESSTRGADRVVLTMFFAVLFAFAVAVVNVVTTRAFGFRFLSKIAQQATVVMVPPLFLIFLVLGTIFIGLATPTEGGAMGAVGAVALAAAKRRLTLDLVRQAVRATAKLSAFAIFILIGARVFSLTFYGVNGHVWVEHLLTSLPGGEVGFLIFVNLLVFVLAFFLDYFELAFIIIPLLAPVADKLGIDLIWFGVILAVNMQTSFMHPPFGFALFFLRSVAPKFPYRDRVTGLETAPITTGQIYWGAVPFVIIQLIGVAMVILFPQLVMHYKGSASTVDPKTIEIQIAPPETPPALDLR
ncbi:TRAP transporter large permease subunit [Rhodoplanes sp. TEM]|uniref:TRAP transporter large permease subunit n=1 Tax=Rhodoplanes tepidamans TaxID=200616 RepID=A0ABT5JDZ0_RHOTP|nr:MULTISPECIES: TRAP transporter large permease subunit [Rhodoplanes]MDC7787718.1 TRAP transporter large permease subunit [Rhodoplanes tepidamans]MDC7986614.1 TRAP transporter large permease subunit [Rhodoplanes sp. TEM]MDQ0356474.1 TRAP-type mannitol/chloroaromatic compound transport system permease large subunit [Rhodoplanes tepidamans]